MLGPAGPQGADLRRSLLSDVRLVLGEHLKTNHVHPAVDVKTTAGGNTWVPPTSSIVLPFASPSISRRRSWMGWLGRRQGVA